MSTTRRNLFAAGFTIPALGAGAATAGPQSQSDILRIIYNRSAQYHLPDRNPVIVIPGILGTRLIDTADHQTVWGAFDGIALNPVGGSAARRLALPITGPILPAVASDSVQAQSVLDKVRIRLLGIPFQLRQYAQILATLGVGGYRDETLGLNGVDYGSDHFTCFQFAYDWRRDNAQNAGALKRFMDAKRVFVAEQYRRKFNLKVAPDSIKFDVVAHSMGALLFRYFLRYGDQALSEDAGAPTLDWAGAPYVDRAILVAPPNAGSALSLRYLVEGEDFGRPLLPYYPPAILASYPSIYQLLPRQGFELDDAGAKPPDLFDPQLWSANGWGLAAPDQAQLIEALLPEVSDPDRRRDLALAHLARLLARGRQFQEALDRPALAPEGLDVMMVVGDGVATDQSYGFDRGARRLKNLRQAPGDGAVTRASALFDERTAETWTPQVRSPLRPRSVLFTSGDHLGLTRSQVFNDNVLYWLLEEPRGDLGARYAV